MIKNVIPEFGFVDLSNLKYFKRKIRIISINNKNEYG